MTEADKIKQQRRVSRAEFIKNQREKLAGTDLSKTGFWLNEYPAIRGSTTASGQGPVRDEYQDIIRQKERAGKSTVGTDELIVEDLANILYGPKNWRNRGDFDDPNTGGPDITSIVSKVHRSNEKNKERKFRDESYAAADKKVGNITLFQNQMLERAGYMQASAQGEVPLTGPWSPELLDSYWDEQDESKQLPQHQNIGSHKWMAYIGSDEYSVPAEWKKYAQKMKTWEDSGRKGKGPRHPDPPVDQQKWQFELDKQLNQIRHPNHETWDGYQKYYFNESYNKRKGKGGSSGSKSSSKTVGDSTATHMTSNQKYKEGQ